MLHFALLRTHPPPFFYNTARQRNYSCSSWGSFHKSPANDCWLLSSSCSCLKIARLLAGQACQSVKAQHASFSAQRGRPPPILQFNNTFSLHESEGSDTTVVQSEHQRVSPCLTHSRRVPAAAAAEAAASSKCFHPVFPNQPNNTGYQQCHGPEAEHSLPRRGDNLRLPRWKNKKSRWHSKQPVVVEAVVAGRAAISTFLSVFFFLASLFLCLCSEWAKFLHQELLVWADTGKCWWATCADLSCTYVCVCVYACLAHLLGCTVG